MLPQALVQNKIISNPKNSSFTLDWSLAAPIVNLNFFHINKLVDEQSHYRQLLRPWVEKEGGVDTFTYGLLKVHEYGYATTRINTLAPLQVYTGTLLGRQHKSVPTHTTDFIAVTPPYVKYGWQDNSTEFTPIYDLDYPAMFRMSMANLQDRHQLRLTKTFILDPNTNVWTWTTTHPKLLKLSVHTNNDEYPYLRRSTDIVFGRILLNNECIANILINIKSRWNSNAREFEISFSFQNNNYPSNAIVELY